MTVEEYAYDHLYGRTEGVRKMNDTSQMNGIESREFLKQNLLAYIDQCHAPHVQHTAGSSVVGLINQMYHAVQTDNRAPNWDVVVEYIAELQRVGALCILGCNSDEVRHVRNISTLVLTAWGQRLLEGTESSPGNPEQYFSGVLKRVRFPDPVALVYLREAAKAWAAGLDRSTAVMLGCACERLVRMLASAVQSAGIEPWSNKLAEHEKKVVAGKAKPMAISAVYDQVRQALLAQVQDKKLPGDLADIVDRQLSAIFDQARMLRNSSGHPTGEDISSEDAHAGLLLFPGFHQTVNRLIEAITGN